MHVKQRSNVKTRRESGFLVRSEMLETFLKKRYNKDNGYSQNEQRSYFLIISQIIAGLQENFINLR